MPSFIQTNRNGSHSITFEAISDLGELAYFLMIATEANRKQSQYRKGPMDILALTKQLNTYIGEYIA